MSFLNKTYIHDKDDEFFKKYMESLGLSDDQLKEQLNFKPSDTLKKVGDQYFLSMTDPDGDRDIKFKDGVEFDEEVSPGIVGKSKFIIGDNIVIESHSFEDGLSLNYRREYSGDKLVMVITSNKWDGIARRYFKAA